MRAIRNKKSGKIDLRSLKAAIRDQGFDVAKLNELSATIGDHEVDAWYYQGLIARTVEAINGGHYNP